MKTYKALFHPAGPFTSLPDAQTIFGAICQIILETKGEDALQTYFDSFKTTPWMVHSAMFPDGAFPAPRKGLFTISYIRNRINSADRNKVLDVMAQMKQFKKIGFVSQGIFRDYLLQNRFDELGKCLQSGDKRFALDSQTIQGISLLQYKDEPIIFETRTVQTVRNANRDRVLQMDEDRDSDLFYQVQTYSSKDTNVCFYIKSDLDKKELEQILKFISISGIGKKRSSGLNGFEFLKLEEFDLPSSIEDAYLLSECIPDEGEFDYSKSNYSVVSHLYRGSYSYVGDAYTGRFNGLDKGSLMKAAQKKEYYGRLVETRVKNKTIYHYGLGFVL